MTRACRTRLTRRPPRGLALPAALLLLLLLALLLAAGQRSAALQWRAAALRATRLQARADARAAADAAQRWLLALALRPATQRGEARQDALPRAWSDAPDPARLPWPRAWSRGIDGCRGACGFRLQALASTDGGSRGAARPARALRIHAYADGPAPAVLQRDVLLLQEASGRPRLLRLGERSLR